LNGQDTKSSVATGLLLMGKSGLRDVKTASFL